MYKRILVAFDESAVAERALHEALMLAKECQAVLRVVHAVDVMFPATTDMVYVDLETYRQDRVLAGQEVLKRAADMARAAGVEAETAVVEVEGSRYSNAILADARSWGAQLIVLGTHGRGALLHLLLGSVAERIVRHSPVPVLLVGGEPRAGQPRG